MQMILAGHGLHTVTALHMLQTVYLLYAAFTEPNCLGLAAC